MPAKWKTLKDLLVSRGEAIASPSLEIKGHHCGDSATQETTILIGLQPRQ